MRSFLLLPIFFYTLLAPAPLHTATYYVNFQVRDSTGLYLPKVSLEDVKIFVDGAEKKPAYIFGQDLPMAIAIFFDVGPQMAPDEIRIDPLYLTRLQRARAVTLEMLDRLKTDYAMALYSYFYEPVRLVDFTNDAQSLENALRKLQPAVKHPVVTQPDAKTLVALEQGIEVLKNRDEKRKILMLFTYVMDPDSSKTLDMMARRLSRRNIALYVVSFGPRTASGPGFSTQERMNSFWFKKLIDGDDGGFYLTDLYREDLRELAFEIASRWNAMQTLAFEGPEVLAGKSLRIEMNRPHSKALSRSRVPFDIKPRQ
ncbi:MAG TPA: hypothetical protein VGQ81_08735 [Acidobacteriota bacterium]|jgi:hypothetical protein|nr:hypothetical protein [Acidobacteriota bacterium]